MVSNAQSDTELLHCDPQNIPRASLTRSAEASPPKGKNVQRRVSSLVDFLTVYHHPHIPDKTVNNIKGLRCSYPSLILGESVEPLEYRFDILLSKKLLNKLFCVTSSRIL